MNPRVVEVSGAEEFRLNLVFTNGERGVFDCSDLLEFGVFKELQDISYFRRVFVADGAVAWPHEQDICPDTLYLKSTTSDQLGEGGRTRG